MKQAGKRDSVTALAGYDGHSSKALRCRRAQATYPQTQWATSTSAYLVLLRVEIAAFHSGLNRLVSVALILASRRTGVTRYAARWCPDFPLRIPEGSRSDRLACFTPTVYAGTRSNPGIARACDAPASPR